MKRTPMKRTAFKRSRKEPSVERAEKPMATLTRPLALHRGTYAGETGEPAPKREPVRDENYRRLVAQLPCIHCGVEGRSQAAHPNTGKGGATKADDDLCFPLCADSPVRRGCHSLFDQGGLFPKAERRQIEATWTEQTRLQLAKARA